jgi:PAS domain S-box-containing protein
MKILDQEKMERIKALLKTNPRGLSITNLASITGMNRNLIAKYLDMLVISGQVEIQQYGPAKVFFLSQRIPVSAMIEITHDLVMVLDQDRKIVHVNKPFTQFLAIKRENLLGKDIGGVGHPFLSSIPLPGPSEPLDGENRGTGEIRYTGAAGDCFFRIKRAPAVFEDGAVGLTLIIEDITEQRRYQENLRLSEARYRGIVQDQTEFITRYLPDTTLTFVNQALCQYLNCRAEDLVGKRFIEMLPEDERQGVLKSLGSLSAQSPTAALEHRMSDGRGQMRWQHWTNRAIFDENGTLREFQGMGRDITEQRETAEKISRYILQLEFISRKAMEFVHPAPDTDVYLTIAQGVRSLCPDAMVSVHSYDRQTGSMTVVTVIDKDARARIREILGKDPVGIQFHPTPDIMDKTMEGVLHRFPSGTYVSCFAQTLTGEEISRVREDMGPLDTYLMGLTHGKELYGEILIVLKKGAVLQHQHILETYLNQASVAVQRQIYQERLRQSKEEYRRIIETSAEGIWVLDRDYRTTFVNPRGAEMIGYTPNEMVGRQVEEFMEPEDIPTHRQRVIERRAGLIGRFEQRFRKKDGFLIWTLANATPIFEKGEFAGAFAMLTDITEQKKAEDALRESEQKYRALVEQASDGIVVVQNGIIKFCNRRVAEMWGGDVREIVGQSYENFIDPTEIARVREKYLRRMAGEEVSQVYNTLLVKRDGTRVNADLSAGAFTYEGKPADLIVLRDITERKKAEEELEKTHDLQRAILNASPVGISLVSNHTIGWGNEVIMRILGIQPGEWVGLPESVVFADNVEYERVSREVYQAIEQQGFGEVETVLKRKDGTRVDVSLRAAPIRPGSPEIIVVVTDITTQKQAERTLRESEETFRTMVSISPLPLSLIDATGKYLHVNPAFTRVFGYTLEDIPDGKAWFALAYPEEETRREAIRLWKADAAEHPAGDVRPRTFRVRCKDGSFREVLFLPAATPAGLQVVVYQDITGERIHTRLRESEDLYRHMVEDLNIGIYRSSGDPEGRFIWGNTGLISILGFEDLADLRGIPVKDIFQKPNGRKALLKVLQEKKFVKNQVLSLKKKDGTPVKVSVTALAEFDEKGTLQFITGLVQELPGRSGPDTRNP